MCMRRMRTKQKYDKKIKEPYTVFYCPEGHGEWRKDEYGILRRIGK